MRRRPVALYSEYIFSPSGLRVCASERCRSEEPRDYTNCSMLQKMLCLLALTGASGDGERPKQGSWAPSWFTERATAAVFLSPKRQKHSFFFAVCSQTTRSAAHSAAYGEVHSRYLHQQAPPACTAHAGGDATHSSYPLTHPLPAPCYRTTEMSVETRAIALLLQMVRTGESDPTKSAIAALKTERNNVKCTGVNNAVALAKQCLIALREIEIITRGVKATRDVVATPDVLAMCASSDEEKQVAKTAWDVKIAAKIVKRKAAQKRNRAKPSVRLATASRQQLWYAQPSVRLKEANKRKADGAKFGTDKNGNSNTPANAKRRKKLEGAKKTYGVDEKGFSKVPDAENKRKKLIVDKKTFGVNIDGDSNVPSAEKARAKLIEDKKTYGVDEKGFSNTPKNKQKRKKLEEDKKAGKRSPRVLAIEAERAVECDMIIQNFIDNYGDFPLPLSAEV